MEYNLKLLCIAGVIYSLIFYEVFKSKRVEDGVIKLPNPVYHWVLAIAVIAIWAVTYFHYYFSQGFLCILGFFLEGGVFETIIACFSIYYLYLPPFKSKEKYREQHKNKARSKSEEENITREGEHE